MINLCPAFGWDSPERRIAALHQIKNSDEYFKGYSIGELNGRYTGRGVGVDFGAVNSLFKGLAYVPALNILVGLGRILFSTHGYIRESNRVDSINKKEVLTPFDKHQLKSAARVKQEYVEHIKRGIAECLLGPLLIIIDLVVTIWNDKIIKNYCKENNLPIDALKNELIEGEKPSHFKEEEDVESTKEDDKIIESTQKEVKKPESNSSKPVESSAPKQEDLGKADVKSSTSVEKAALSKQDVKKPVWRQFLETEMANQLKSIDRTFGEAEEKGDCLFDAVAQQLNKQGKLLTKKDIRNAVFEHLKKVNQDPYSQEVIQYKALIGDEVEYEELCSQVNKCVEDFEDKGTPVWGNEAIVQMIADIFNVEVKIYVAELMTITIADTFPGKQYEKFNYIPTKDMQGLPALEICTLIETKEDMIKRFEPLEGTKNGVIELANIKRDPWGHWMPVDQFD